MLKWLAGILDRVFAVIGALLFLQAPMFMMQYVHNLAGHVAELQLQMELMRKTAASTGKTLEQYVSKFMSNSDPDFSKQGEIMQGMIDRWENLSSGLHSLMSSNVFARPFVFMYHFDYSVAKDTYSHFQFGLTFSLEGIVYSMIGLVIGYFIFRLLALIASLFVPKKEPSLR